MKKIFLLFCTFIFSLCTSAQTENDYGTIVNFSLKSFQETSQRAMSNSGLVAKLSFAFPLPNGSKTPFVFDETLISSAKIPNIQTYDAVSSDGKVRMKLTITPTGMNGIMHTPEGYFFIEPSDVKNNQYRIYQSSDVKNATMNCGQHGEVIEPQKNGRMLSVSPFPVGTQLRKYILAAAATGEMTTLYGSQTAARDQIISVMNANNLIYELEASIKFELAPQTTNLSIIFTDANTDPFTPISVDDSQAGFTTMHTNGTLPYTAYGIGHTFNTLPSAGPNSFSGNGVAGPTPCVDDSKSRAFTQWTLGSPLSLILNIFTHEVAHQFAAWHTYNAIGGTGTNGSFCINGWNNTSAIEPGSGTTMMSYANNCVNPTNYTLSGNNKLQYFNTKSLEQIFNSVNNTAPGGTGSCLTSTATTNTPPVVNTLTNITIPKGTPFTLNGSATDANNDALNYTWEQYDVATDNDKGALGSSINGIGGYPAVNSTTAPLFRSERSATSTSRTFPKMIYITNNANNPNDNEGEDLPQVARTMKFRFTVNDNKGGVDSNEMTVTVSADGPLEVSVFNTAQTIAAGSSQTITWNVNNTNTLGANVRILLSSDGGNTFPFVLSNSTPNNGSASVTIPTNIANTTQGRIKVTCELNPNAEFFDVNNANITITSNCLAKTTFICPEASVSGAVGAGVLNLGLNFVTGVKSTSLSKSYPTAGLTNYPVINYTDNTYTTCQASSWGTEKAVLVPFRVTKTGNHTISSSGTGGNVHFSIFTSNTNFDCTTFINSNSNGAIGSTNPRTVTLNECTTYYALLYVINGTATSATFNLQSQVGGEIIEVETNQAGFNYTYAAVNQTSNQITSVSATSDFTSLPAGNYKVYGITYETSFNPTTLVNQTINQAYNSGLCLVFSNNTKTLTVIGAGCQSSLALSGAAMAGTQQASQSITSTQTIATGVNVTYRAGNSITLSPQTGSGFSAANGSVFQTQIGGCN